MRTQAPRAPNPRGRLALAALLLVIAAAAGAALWRRQRAVRPLRIATGLRGGTFLPLGGDLAAAFRRDVRRVTPRALESPGGSATVAMLRRREVELALLSNNTRGDDSIRLVAPLYEETLQVVARRDARIAGPLDLRGKRLSVGPAGSGTEAIAWQVLRHFGMRERDVDARNLTPVEAQRALVAGDLDAAFIVAGMRTPVVDALLSGDAMALVSLGDPARRGSALEGIRLDAPYLRVAVVPEHTYGSQPPEPVGTLGVTALLVARRDLDDDLVRDLTESLFANRVRLAERERLIAHLTEHFDPADAPYAVHPGADLYYRRDDPSLIARYTDQISLAITVGALLWSGLTALRAARRRSRRGRIERHYEEAQRLATLLRAGDLAALRDAREGLAALRARAFDELAAEQLEANESFTILLDYLTSLLAEADRVAAR